MFERHRELTPFTHFVARQHTERVLTVRQQAADRQRDRFGLVPERAAAGGFAALAFARGLPVEEFIRARFTRRLGIQNTMQRRRRHGDRGGFDMFGGFGRDRGRERDGRTQRFPAPVCSLTRQTVLATSARPEHSVACSCSSPNAIPAGAGALLSPLHSLPERRYKFVGARFAGRPALSGRAPCKTASLPCTGVCTDTSVGVFRGSCQRRPSRETQTTEHRAEHSYQQASTSTIASSKIEGTTLGLHDDAPRGAHSPSPRTHPRAQDRGKPRPPRGPPLAGATAPDEGSRRLDA